MKCPHCDKEVRLSWKFIEDEDYDPTKETGVAPVKVGWYRYYLKKVQSSEGTTK